MQTKLIIGLGNPGKKFEKTRHNVGFIVLDELQKSKDFPAFRFNKKFNAQLTENILDDEKVILAKPRTFMNTSGKTISAIVNFYKIKLQNIIVIHDDLDLELGKVKFKEKGSSGGHKGVQSIINELGTNEFKRIKIGIGRPKEKDGINDLPRQQADERYEKIVSDYVLKDFNDEEIKIIKKVISDIIKKEF